jgi:preprotein translocase subunit SecG
MLTLSIYLLTAIMVIDCLFLVLLVLVQLPKKEAGMGQAFGGAATDALLGAGSGNVLTKITRWAAGVFFVLAILLTVLGNVANTSGGGSTLQKNLSKNQSSSALPAAPTNTAAAPAGTTLKFDGLPGLTNAAPTNK